MMGKIVIAVGVLLGLMLWNYGGTMRGYTAMVVVLAFGCWLEYKKRAKAKLRDIREKAR